MKRAVVALLLSSACVPRYKPPSADQPHAIVKVRRTYESVDGERLRESVQIGGHRALHAEEPGKIAESTRVDATLMHPGPARLEVRAEFFHSEMRTVREQYQERRSRMDWENYDCSTGFGSNKVHRTCRRSVTRYDTETKWRTVNKWVEVTDGSCSANLSLHAAADAVYLAQFTYQRSGVCSLSCFEQKGNGAGEFTNVPCPEPAEPVP
jgi:hypothetical protein